METGVYIINNLVNGKFYVGSTTKSFRERWLRHLATFKLGKHNKLFQNAWDKYGEDSFVLEVLERCAPGVCIEREQFWLDLLKPYDREIGYNICPVAGNTTGVKHPPEILAIISAKLKGRKISSENLAKLVASNTGRIHSNRKPIYQYDTNGTFIQSFPCIREAVKLLHPDKNLRTTMSHIHRVCRGERKSSHGYVWSWLPPST